MGAYRLGIELELKNGRRMKGDVSWDGLGWVESLPEKETKGHKKGDRSISTG